ncbi:MAG: transposase [Fermentimonas sp.]|nr:transposase [Fermentimonas sp.]
MSNAKRNFLNNFHHIDAAYLQNYLDEFAYKLNWRYLRDKKYLTDY